MNDTRAEIVRVALELFNKNGISSVSLRDIAEKMQISPGNLTYHFRRREQILEALYHDFVSEVEQKIGSFDASKANLALLMNVIQGMTEIRLKYRFIMQDLLLIMNENKVIRQHYRETLRLRKVQFVGLIEIMVKTGLFRKPVLEREYEFFYDRIQILGSFWIASAGLDGKKIDEKRVKENHEMIAQSIHPYLTTKGKKEWVKLL